MHKNDAFDAKIVNTRLTKIFIAIFAPDERLPSFASLDRVFWLSYVRFKYKIRTFDVFNNVEIYALLGRTKWTQIPRQEDQNQFQGLGDALAMFLWRFLVHDRTKKYKYNQCNKHFSQNINLKTLFLVHTGENARHCHSVSNASIHQH